MSRPRQRKGRSGSRRELSREMLVEEALRLVDLEGADAVSIRRLAGEVGCGAATLYTYFSGWADIMASVVDRLYSEMDVEVAAGDNWQDLVRRIAASYRNLALQHPRAFELVALDDNDAPPSSVHVERILVAFQSTGLSRRGAVELFSVADGFASGFLLMETRARLRQDGAESSAGEGRDTRPLGRFLEASLFEFGLNAVILGLEQAWGSQQS